MGDNEGAPIQRPTRTRQPSISALESAAYRHDEEELAGDVDKAVEGMIRRIGALQLVEEGSSWRVAEAMQNNNSRSVIPRHFVRAALRESNIVEKMSTAVTSSGKQKQSGQQEQRADRGGRGGGRGGWRGRGGAGGAPAPAPTAAAGRGGADATAGGRGGAAPSQ